MAGGKDALISQIMDCSADAWPGSPARQFLLMLNKECGGRGLPIVQMNQFRFPIGMKGEVSDDLGKENETLRIVGIIDTIALI